MDKTGDEITGIRMDPQTIWALLYRTMNHCEANALRGLKVPHSTTPCLPSPDGTGLLPLRPRDRMGRRKRVSFPTERQGPSLAVEKFINGLVWVGGEGDALRTWINSGAKHQRM